MGRITEIETNWHVMKGWHALGFAWRPGHWDAMRVTEAMKRQNWLLGMRRHAIAHAGLKLMRSFSTHPCTHATAHTQAIKDIRGNNKVQDQDPEGKYEALVK